MGKGVKRKLSADEDGFPGVAGGEDGDAGAAERLCPGSGAGGVVVDGGRRGGPGYTQRRQRVLDASLRKMHAGQALRDPSLRRSVLVANTVRRIQTEMCGEEERAAAAAGAVAAAAAMAAAFACPGDVEREPTPAPGCAVCHDYDGSEGGPDYERLAKLGAVEQRLLHGGLESISCALTSALKDLVFGDGDGSGTSGGGGPVGVGPAAAAGVCVGGNGGVPRGWPATGGCDWHELDSVFSGLEIAVGPAARLLADLEVELDDHFADIDTSMYDDADAADPWPPGLSVSLLVAPGKVPPGSLSEDLLRNLSPCGGGVGGGGGSQPLRSSDFSELDQIMEVLVGS
ncbi:SERTA domain-containing protein 2-like [Lethenteron reissneri]|uniref:SERTA domain-containing protein 2-like n=1 Tax=Lethenteron reissneri TaxID=7753 RepID=UPI002AB65375|nr:SERTA domain-containing protein 2-like [Lethenteron reissneri]